MALRDHFHPPLSGLRHWHAFHNAWATYLQQAVGLVVVDVVTGRRANLHQELLERLASPNVSSWDAELYATAYRVTEHGGQPSLEIWRETLAVGRGLPTMPLWLRGDL